MEPKAAGRPSSLRTQRRELIVPVKTTLSHAGVKPASFVQHCLLRPSPWGAARTRTTQEGRWSTHQPDHREIHIARRQRERYGPECGERQRRRAVARHQQMTGSAGSAPATHRQRCKRIPCPSVAQSRRLTLMLAKLAADPNVNTPSRIGCCSRWRRPTMHSTTSSGTTSRPRAE